MGSARTAFLFPGQGSQFVGMGQDLYREYTPARALFDVASEEARADIAALCFRGPFPALSETAVLQPAITVVSLACHSWLKANGVEAWAAAGHSLGEYAALECAGVLTERDAIRVAAERGRRMGEAAANCPGTMIAVVDLPADRVVAETARVLQHAEGGIANFNGPDQVVLSGTVQAMEAAARHFQAIGARTVPLAVSGAWHSELMLPAEGPFAAFLAGVDMTPPRLRLYLNATGAPADTVDEIRGALVRQLRNPVRWIDDVKGLIADGVTRFVEVGPGKILRGTLRRIWPDASAYEVHSVCDLASLRRLAEACRA